MKTIILFLLILLFSENNPAQFGNRNQSHLPLSKKAMNNIYSETHLIPGDSSFFLFYSFRIPNSSLVFLKENNHYTANVNLLVEVLDENSIPAARQIKQMIVSTDSFDLTISNSVYTQGLLTFRLNSGEYQIVSTLQDKNLSGDIRLPPVKIDTKEAERDVLKPLITENKSIECDDRKLFPLINFSELLPLSRNSYNLIVPVQDTSVSELELIIRKSEDTIVSRTLTEYFFTGIELKECNKEIVLDFGIKHLMKNFVLKDFSFLLDEDNYQLEIFFPGKMQKPEKYPLKVNWINKPNSLSDPAFAFNMINLIEPDSVITRLLEQNGDSIHKSLINYWKKIDPTPFTAFNELMYEFYLRVDYVLKNFSTITGKNGVDTDRGKFFIKYGKPYKVERSSNEKGAVTEKWYYKDKDFVITFVDDRGTGDFRLIE